jgi:hypothetical protein
MNSRESSLPFSLVKMNSNFINPIIKSRHIIFSYFLPVRSGCIVPKLEMPACDCGPLIGKGGDLSTNSQSDPHGSNFINLQKFNDWRNR